MSKEQQQQMFQQFTAWMMGCQCQPPTSQETPLQATNPLQASNNQGLQDIRPELETSSDVESSLRASSSPALYNEHDERGSKSSQGTNI